MSKSPTPKERLIAELLPLTHWVPWEVARKHKERARRYRHWAVEADGAGFTDEAETFHRIADRYVQLFLGFLNDKASVLVRMMLSDPRMPADSRMLDGDIDPANAANLAIRAVQLLTAAGEAPGGAQQPAEAVAESVKLLRPKRRGRKKADYETVQREAALAAAWARARDSGVYKGDFARDHGMSIKQLDALLDRVAKRNRHSE